MAGTMIVMKFGGTSVGSVEAIKQVVEIVGNYREHGLSVVLSAMSKVTDALRAMAATACGGTEPTAALEALRKRHEETVCAVAEGDERKRALEDCAGLIDELSGILHGITLLRELSPRSADLVSSFGERLSVIVVSAALRSAGLSSIPVDAREYVKTNERYTEAEVNFAETDRRLSEGLAPMVSDGRIPIITGFLGSTDEGVTTTLGRGASDYTASLVGGALHAGEIWIWTDVDGAMTADPRIVGDARVLEEISYLEAAEMSYFGAKVLHPMTMLPAVKQEIPIRIRNTFRPGNNGTVISPRTRAAPLGVKAVTSIDRLCLIVVEGTSLSRTPDTHARLFKTTAERKTQVVMITQASSEHDICLAVDERDSPGTVQALKEEFRHEVAEGSLEEISVQSDLAVVAVVGGGMKGTPGIAARTFGILGEHGINIIAIAQGSSELNISFIVERKDLQKTVQLVHASFGLGGDGGFERN